MPRPKNRRKSHNRNNLGRIPGYRLHKASGQAVVTLNGRDIYLGAHNTEASRREYDRLVAEWMAHGRRLPCRDDDDGVSVAELLAAYVEHAKAYYRRADGSQTSTVATVLAACRPVAALYAEIDAADFGPVELRTVRQRMIEHHDWCRRTCNEQVNLIRRIFRWGVEHELVPPTVLEGLRAVAGLRAGRTEARESKRVMPVDPAQVEAIRPHVSRQVWAMIELQRLTAARPGEITCMRLCDLDTSGDVWLFRPSTHKNQYRGHERIIRIGPRGQDIIGPFMAGRAIDAPLFSPIEAEAERRERMHAARKTPIGYGNRPGSNRKRSPKWQPGERYTTNEYGRAIRRACDAAGVDRWHPHQLRHLAATELRKAHGLDVARAVLGHRSLEMADHYAELDHEAAAAVILKVG